MWLLLNYTICIIAKGVICISNGLIPDLGGLAEENSGAENAAGNVSSSTEPVVQFSYDNTLEEIDGAMKSFQARFKSKRGIFSIAAYSLITAAVIVSIVINPTSVLRMPRCFSVQSV